MSTSIQHQVAESGFAIVPRVLDANHVSILSREMDPMLAVAGGAGIRGIARKSPSVQVLAESGAIRLLIEPILGTGMRLVRSILFNKDETSNWHVNWHQDLSIAVKHRCDAEGYDAWTLKEGVQHVQPPVPVLENMLALRLHLDDADATNGALMVSPGSHRLGRIPSGDAAAKVENSGEYLCSVKSGDAILMRPLVLHASRKATSPRPRLVIHLEFAGVGLPPPLEWYEGLGK